MCDRLGQARALDLAGTQLNLLLGLCVGHDSLFMKHSVAPVTVLAVKDRVLGHNPLAAIYFASPRRLPRCRNVVSLIRSVQPPRVSTRRSNFST